MGDAAKYDRLAEGYADRYADPGAIAAGQVHALLRWGPRLGPGAKVLEIGCADGFVTEHLVAAGLDVLAVDFAPAMVDRARQRLVEQGLGGWRVEVADLNHLSHVEVDAVLASMWTFFAYAERPDDVLRQLRAMATTKVIVDVNPRSLPVRDAVAAMRAAGYRRVSWRPFLVPQTTRLPAPLRVMARATERVPGLRAVPIRWRFVALVQGQP